MSFSCDHHHRIKVICTSDILTYRINPRERPNPLQLIDHLPFKILTDVSRRIPQDWQSSVDPRHSVQLGSRSFWCLDVRARTNLHASNHVSLHFPPSAFVNRNACLRSPLTGMIFVSSSDSFLQPETPNLSLFAHVALAPDRLVERSLWLHRCQGTATHYCKKINSPSREATPFHKTIPFGFSNAKS